MNMRGIGALTLSLALLSSALAYTSKNGFTLSEPKGWQRVSGIEGPEVIFAQGSGQTNFNVITTPADGIAKLDASTEKLFFDTVYSSIAKSIKGFKAVSRKSGKLGGQPSLELVYTTPDGLQFFQVITAYRNKSVILTFTSSPTRFAKDLAVFNTVKNSFKFSR